MPDIAMCEGKDCPSKNKCYRYLAVPDQYRQAYMDFNARRQGDKCDRFWPVDEKSTAMEVEDG